MSTLGFLTGLEEWESSKPPFFPTFPCKAWTTEKIKTAKVKGSFSWEWWTSSTASNSDFLCLFPSVSSPRSSHYGHIQWRKRNWDQVFSPLGLEIWGSPCFSGWPVRQDLITPPQSGILQTGTISPLSAHTVTFSCVWLFGRVCYLLLGCKLLERSYV